MAKFNDTFSLSCKIQLFKKKAYIHLFLERGKGREKEKERNINVWFALTRLLLATWPETQACALTWT